MSFSVEGMGRRKPAESAHGLPQWPRIVFPLLMSMVGFPRHLSEHWHKSLSRSPSRSLALSLSLALSHSLSVSLSLSRSRALTLSLSRSIPSSLWLSLTISQSLTLSRALSLSLSPVLSRSLLSLSLSVALCPLSLPSPITSLPVCLCPVSFSKPLPLSPPPQSYNNNNLSVRSAIAARDHPQSDRHLGI